MKIDLQKKKIISMYKRGFTLGHIAFAHGVSIRTILNRLEEWNVKKRKKIKNYFRIRGT